MRKVIAEIWNGNVKEEVEAVFHTWSTHWEELRDGVGQYPAAIVELQDGRVKIAYAESIRFVKE